jgi:6-pyruvoyltetrahydropterin/6-carboxytetrahydropterin synthase
MWTLRKEVEFDAAHRLPGHQGKCANLHGHRWKVTFEVDSEELNDMDMVVDFGTLSALVRELDHLYINDLEIFKTMIPTAENMACYFANRVLIANPHVSRVKVSVEESPGSEVCYEQCQRNSE